MSSPRPRPRTGGLLDALAAEWRKVRRQKLPYVAVALTLGACVLSGLWAGRTDHGLPVNGYYVFCVAARWGFRTAGFLLLLFGATSVAGEATAGALKLVLVRPIGRIRYLLAKVIVLVLLAALLTLLITGASWFLGDRMEAERIGTKPHVAVGLAGLSLLAFGALGLLISTLTSSSATAVMASILTVLPLYILPPFLGDNARFLFTEHATRYLEIVGEFAKGFDERWDAELIRPGLRTPPAYFAVLLAAALLIFRRKDIQL